MKASARRAVRTKPAGRFTRQCSNCRGYGCTACNGWGWEYVPEAECDRGRR